MSGDLIDYSVLPVLSPGYYAVTLEDYSIRVELTATKRVGLHRYTFPASVPQKNVLFPLR